MSAKVKPHRQPPLRGKSRKPQHSAFRPELEAAVQREMAFFNTGRSYVIATAVAFALSVKEQEDYRDAVESRKKRKRSALTLVRRRVS